MTTKNTATAWKNTAAQDGLEDLIEMSSDESSTGGNASGNDGSIGGSDTVGNSGNNDGYTSAGEDFNDETDEMEFGSGGPRVELFLVHEAYDGMDPKTNQVIPKGVQIDGIYAGSFTAGQYNSRRHKLKATSGEFAGKVVGLPTCGKLDSEFQFVPEGARAIIRYDGRATKADVGPAWKGQLPYRYQVGLPSKLRAAIKAGSLKANYELKKKEQN